MYQSIMKSLGIPIHLHDEQWVSRLEDADNSAVNLDFILSDGQ